MAQLRAPQWFALIHQHTGDVILTTPSGDELARHNKGPVFSGFGDTETLALMDAQRRRNELLKATTA